jgi:hypothetical protein
MDKEQQGGAAGRKEKNDIRVAARKEKKQKRA